MVDIEKVKQEKGKLEEVIGKAEGIEIRIKNDKNPYIEVIVPDLPSKMAVKAHINDVGYSSSIDIVKG